MRVLVIGASGLTGSHLVHHLLAQGHDVTAFVRDPAKYAAAAPAHASLKVARGDVRDAPSLDAAVAGQDAVLSAVGPRNLGKDDMQEVFMRNVIAAMKKAGVRRFVSLGAVGAGDSRDKIAFWQRYALIPLLLHNVFADKERGEELLFASGLDYVNCRPGMLLNGAARGLDHVKASLEGCGWFMNREDVALFMIAQLASNTWVGKSPLIGY